MKRNITIAIIFVVIVVSVCCLFSCTYQVNEKKLPNQWQHDSTLLYQYDSVTVRAGEEADEFIEQQDSIAVYIIKHKK